MKNFSLFDCLNELFSQAYILCKNKQQAQSLLELSIQTFTEKNKTLITKRIEANQKLEFTSEQIQDWLKIIIYLFQRDYSMNTWDQHQNEKFWNLNWKKRLILYLNFKNKKNYHEISDLLTIKKESVLENLFSALTSIIDIDKLYLASKADDQLSFGSDSKFVKDFALYFRDQLDSEKSLNQDLKDRWKRLNSLVLKNMPYLDILVNETKNLEDYFLAPFKPEKENRRKSFFSLLNKN